MFGLQARILTILDWKIYSFLMSQTLTNMVNTDVFIRFLIFDIFLNLMSLASLRGLILDTLGGIWLPKSDILGSWEGIGIFITFEGISSLSLGGAGAAAHKLRQGYFSVTGVRGKLREYFCASWAY